MKTLSIKLPEALAARVAALAARRGASKSAVIRGAIEKAFANGSGRKAGSFFQLAKDLAGCVAGPADLSHKPRHLRGYGR